MRVEATETGGEILAVVVLYQLQAEASAAFLGMRHAIEGAADTRREVELMVCDNTPYDQPAPRGFAGVYSRDPTNPGLARCYNRALARAKERGAAWLLLLDQDTTVTPEFLHEAQRLVAEIDGRRQPGGGRELNGSREIVALVPKLVDARGVGMSPHPPPTWRHFGADLEWTGVAERRLCAFNSGAVVRVSAIEAIGGFREDFPLDFLDHATFTQMQSNGGRVYVMRSRLAHELSLSGPKRPGFSVSRHRSSVEAECRFYREFGTAMDRLYLKTRLLRHALGAAVKRGDWERAGYMAAAAVGRSPVRAGRPAKR